MHLLNIMWLYMHQDYVSMHQTLQCECSTLCDRRCVIMCNAPVTHCAFVDALRLCQHASECAMQAVKRSDYRCNRTCQDIIHGCSWMCTDITDAWIGTTWVLCVNYPPLSSLCWRGGEAPGLLWWAWTPEQSPFDLRTNQIRHTMR